MTVQEVYMLGVEMGMKADPRGAAGLKRLHTRLKKEFEDLPKSKKALFDQESLTNPYADSRILWGNPKQQIKKIMAGIDAGAAEILLADRLNQKGEKIDLVISHHPSGHALAALHDVMDLQIEGFADVGVPVNVAHNLMSERMLEVQRRFSPINHNQTVDTARLLEMPLLALHTIWDNLGDKFIKDYIAKRKYDTVGELLDYLNEIPEFVEATYGKNGPIIVSGSPKSRAGRVDVFFTGGTNASKEMYIEHAKAGVGTLVDMHIPEDALQELKKRHVNVINSGHMASDSIGANLFLDALEKKGVKVIACSGLIRVKRK